MARRKRFDEAAGTVIGGVLAGLAAVRRGKSVHPDGVVHEARFVVSGLAAAPAGARLLREPGEYRAVVRFSRSLGVPRPLPDLLGISIRVLEPFERGRHQDFLLVTSVDRPILHHVFVPASDVQQRIYTSSLPYRAGDERFLVGVLPRDRSPRGVGRTEFDRLATAAATGELAFDVAVASVEGRFTPVAELRIGDRLPAAFDALRFNPWNTGAGLEPAGWLNGARRRAYELSQRAWGRAQSEGERHQRDAEAALERLVASAS
jgi:hypothetical protein